MKIVALIEDGLGRRHLLATRAPDLLRRDLSARTGHAELLWCAVPPQGQCANQVIVEALAVLDAREPDRLSTLAVDRIVGVLTDLCVLAPRWAARRRKWDAIFKAIWRWLVHSLRHSLHATTN
jgi:hypothetical protein